MYRRSPLGPMIELLVLEPVMSGKRGLVDTVDEHITRSEPYAEVEAEAFEALDTTTDGSSSTCLGMGLIVECSGCVGSGFIAGT